MESDSDGEDTFVTIGTPQEVPDKDEPRKKPVLVQDIPVKDQKGRPRFHGAFTGGFSAGYFNTVGTQKGFTPSTFVSSRNERQTAQTGQRPEDFMDEEDLGEHGIAPRKYVTSASFASEERRKRRHDEAMLATSESDLLGSSALLNLIVPERITIGVKLLRKMGWKEGQGVGPSLKKQERKKQATKVYGCALPPVDSDSDSDIDDESLLKDITFAPKDSAHILLNAKDNTKGLGYRGLDPSKALPSSHINLFSNPVMSKRGRKGIRGQAFGVGALEEEDEDIYAVDDMSNYDMTMTAENEKDTFGWTGSRNQKQSMTPVGYVGKLLEGFKLSSTKLIQKKDFPPPKLPPNFRPIHLFQKSTSSMTGSEERGVDYRKFLKPNDSQEVHPSTSIDPHQQGRHRQQVNDSVSRSVALGEQPFVGSVFDLIPEKDKKKIDRAKAGVVMETEQSESKQGDNEISRTDDASLKTAVVPLEKSNQSGPTTQTSSISPFHGGSLGFKPFSSDPAKQQRYDKYLTFVKQGHKDPYSMVFDAGHTEWETEKEKEEFAHAARLFKPLATMMAMRFTSAGVEDKLADVKKQEKVELSEPAKAAAMKMYGKLTREVMEWHPDKLVCKRFNVPDPYPQSNLVGLASLKRDKYSVFNFLTFSNPMEAHRSQQNKDEHTEKDEKTELTKKSEERTLKPRQGSASGLKSIFTHLVNPSKQANRDNVKPGVSFNIKSKVTQKPTEVTRVFEDDTTTGDEGSSQSKQVQKLGDESKSDEPEKSGMDLFRAIFRNTDSESSSDDEDEQKENKGSKNTAQSIEAVAEQDMIESKTEDRPSSVEKPNNDKADASRSEEAFIGISTPAVLPGNGETIPSISERLSPSVDIQDSEDSNTYGPALPPSSNNTESASAQGAIEKTETFIDLTKTSSRKHKHKHKEKHKSKKDKKAKYKKSKHKKKQKKKEKRERRNKDRQRSDTDSSDTSNKDSDSETEIPSDKDLLNKLKQLKPGQRMRAADFM